jgi:hypothetical protein
MRPDLLRLYEGHLGHIIEMETKHKFFLDHIFYVSEAFELQEKRELVILSIRIIVLFKSILPD